MLSIKIGEFAEVKGGKRLPKSHNYSELKTQYPYLRVTDFFNYSINQDDLRYLNPETQKVIKNYTISKGDVYISIAGTIGRVGWIPDILDGANLTENAAKITKIRGFDKKYLAYYLSCAKAQKEISSNTKATSQPKLALYRIEDLSIPLTSLPEQRAIVAKIEQLFSDLDNGIANLKAAQAKLDIYRQAVLKQAFEGELTREWREKQTDLPSGENTIQLALEERNKYYERMLSFWKSAKDSSSPVKKPSKPKYYEAISSLEKELYSSLLPDSWSWTRWGNITYKIGDIDHKMPKDAEVGYPYLSTGNLKKDGTIDFDNAKIISREDFKVLSAKIKPEKNDIIFPRYGTIGRNFLIDFDREFLVSYACAIIKNIPSVIVPKYIYYYSLSPFTKKEIERYVVETTQANIGIASIENFLIPICSLAEQTQIVQEIEARLSVCDKLADTIQTSLQQAEALRQSILKKAFEGRLLSETELQACKAEADWMPAEQLLAQIKSTMAKG
ncbi:restriction endonuclease subunit S [Thiolinea disciformis]|uniref:restriction endonuclease subunit S n=1 Tax=Thiolinea disciformis TaxID=125614 RepID=UPI00037203EE|nr:restriction endonuclease subunit S [Thiolinea disciformis]